MSPKRQEQSQGQQPRFLIYCQKLAPFIALILLLATSSAWLGAAHFAEPAHPQHAQLGSPTAPCVGTPLPEVQHALGWQSRELCLHARCWGGGEHRAWPLTLPTWQNRHRGREGGRKTRLSRSSEKEKTRQTQHPFVSANSPGSPVSKTPAEKDDESKVILEQISSSGDNCKFAGEKETVPEKEKRKKKYNQLKDIRRTELKRYYSTGELCWRYSVS